MRSFSPLIDIPLAVLAYAATLSGMLYWVHRTDQQSVQKTRGTTNRICSRLALVAVALVFACYVADSAFWIVALIVIALVIGASSGELLGILGLPFIALGYLINAYVMGFPGLVLEPPEGEIAPEPGQDQLLTLVGRYANAIGPLRPQGEIQIDGMRFSAMSDSGKMISQGTKVAVTGAQSGKLLARELQDVG